nr:citramalate synthase [Deltaproteobacteria bacterium]
DMEWKNAKICAFGMTRRVGKNVEEDSNIRLMKNSRAPVITIVGKAWDFHVTTALRTTLEENLKAVADTIAYLKNFCEEIFFDAEHFFDGYKRNPEYSIEALQAAAEAGSDCIILCDTNGGSLPSEIAKIIRAVKKRVKTPLGIHCHNDSELAVANSLAAVEAGAIQVQGTVNGYGERCGNANLISVIPGVMVKMALDSVPPEKLDKLTELSRYVSEIANVGHFKRQPYTGHSAFAHKGGMHVSAIRRHPGTYEHLEPETVGNRRRVLISDLSGRSNILEKATQFGIDIKGTDPIAEEVLNRIKELEHQGYQFEGAEASFELLMKKALKTHKPFFELKGFRVIDEKRVEDEPPVAEATIMMEVDGNLEHTAALGNGPVHALDKAIRKALTKFFPEIDDMVLYDYKVRVLTTGEGTGATVRVLIESGDSEEKWGTVGVSHNIIEASWQALTDSIRYKLHKDRLKKKE